MHSHCKKKLIGEGNFVGNSIIDDVIVMSRNKFDLIWQYPHLQDNTLPAPAGEMVWKLRWFTDRLTTHFQEVYTPYGHATIDESMTKFKGH